MFEKKELNKEQLEKAAGGIGNAYGRRYCKTCQKEVEMGPGDDGHYHCVICGEDLGPINLNTK